MKRVLPFLLFVAIAIHLPSQTTLEEYNYITKGYRIQVESGLDMKKGYEFKDLFELVVDVYSTDRTMQFRALHRIGNPKPCAIMVIFQRPDTNFKDHLCIPSFDASPSLWKMYQDKLTSGNYTAAATTALACGIARCTAYYFSK